MSFSLEALTPFLIAQVVRPRPKITPPSFWDWLSQPSGSVFFVLLVALLWGGGAKWRKLRKGTLARDRIAAESPPIDAILEASSHGRAAIVDLFRLLEHPSDPKIRNAAGTSLARLWQQDELVAEEEQAIVTRGFVVDWKARRRYPRGLTQPIPVSVAFGVPFLEETECAIPPGSLLWSYRIEGSDRVSLETFSPWAPPPASANFAINPRDLSANGPHRIVLHARVRTEALTSKWERELPLVPFRFDFDPNLVVESLLTVPDADREALMTRGVTLVADPKAESQAIVTPLNASIAMKNPPILRLANALPCDLAHHVRLEFEGLDVVLPAGEVVALGAKSKDSPREVLLRPQLTFSHEHIGEVRIRAILTVDPQLAWSDPEIRSVWPGTIVTDWFAARLVRL